MKFIKALVLEAFILSHCCFSQADLYYLMPGA